MAKVSRMRRIVRVEDNELSAGSLYRWSAAQVAEYSARPDATPGKRLSADDVYPRRNRSKR